MRSVVLRAAVYASLVLTGVLACGGPEVDGDWPNEPAGFTLGSDLDFSVAIPSGSGDRPYTDDWGVVGGGTDLSIVSDGTAPLSPPNVAQFFYPTGFAAGGSPASMYHSLSGISKYYLGFWWKCNPEWEPNAAGDKLVFFHVSPGTSFILMRNHLLTYENLFGAQDFEPPSGAGTSATTITYGQWYRIEVLLDNDANTFKLWVNGTLNLNVSGVNYPSSFDELHLDPTWGGVQGTKSRDDYFRYDGIRLSHP